MTDFKKFVVHIKKSPYDIYIGRGSDWGNPYSHKKGTKAQFVVSSREEAIEKYVEWLFTQDHLLAKIHTLKGKILGCFCAPKNCHGMVLAELANRKEKIDQFKNEYRFLSNFWPCKIVHEEIVYSSVEHFYQAMKTLDLSLRQKIANLKTPAEAKKFGKNLEIRQDWDMVKLGLMEFGLLQKFYPNSKLAEMLLATGDSELIEGNYWKDIWWGIDLTTGNGLNNLGKLLMKIRSQLKQ